ncbi:glycosyltransferase family 2 protein [Ramlibacter montanisoli]|uniref:Glycosyltransferase n=1 Tax=Ramlibacter montanisoli TaxID=2732512 RepID=A0A849KFE7_9BURK|nr:glycosyltransferase [Ramlibacter montanisoli]NNU43665.1 glycosyltransferase [Ramlibacter montanisoli]
MSEPLFSVVVPTRNRPATARQALDSVLRQNCRDFELIVSDNSTTASTELEEWLRARPDLPARFEYIRTGGGLEMDANWEAASLRARGRYLMMFPDRWVMRGGSLALLASIIAQQDPECVIWDSRLSIQEDGRFRSEVESAGPVRCEIRRSEDLLENLLAFRGYKDKTVYTQPFPRGLNCVTRQDAIDAVRSRVGTLFAPNACDYTSGVSLLLHTRRITHVLDSLYVAIGKESNGERLTIHGIPPSLKHATRWRGLEVDAVLLTVMNDIDATLERHGEQQWSERMDVGNVLLSLLSEIHTKEWHGSPLDTVEMRERIFSYATLHRDTLRPSLAAELAAYDLQFAPGLRQGRKLLQKLKLFYKVYALKHAMAPGRPSARHTYCDDLLSTRSVVVAQQAGSY